MLLVAEPTLGADEAAALTKVVESGWITMGEQVRTFERAFAEQHGADDAVAVASCTAGLHLALRALEIGAGDEVLVPSLTFVATVNSVVYAGATPVFVDIGSLQTPHLSLQDAARKCTERTRAIIIMHYAGFLMDLDAWRAFARSRGLLLIEDAAHAAGMRGVGAQSDAAVFSFFGNKNMTTAEGGMVVARDPDVLVRVRQMRSHGMTSTSWERRQGYALGYDVTELGYNYRMDELRAAMGLVQLQRLAAWNETRRHISVAYREQLETLEDQILVPFAAGDASAHHIFAIVLPRGRDRQQVMRHMRDAGVQTTVHYPCVHQFSYYRSLFPLVTLPVSEDFAQRELTLPLHPKLGPTEVQTVVRALANALRTVAREQTVARAGDAA